MQLQTHHDPCGTLYCTQVAVVTQLNDNSALLLSTAAGTSRYEAIADIVNQALNTSCPNTTQLRVSPAAWQCLLQQPAC